VAVHMVITEQEVFALLGFGGECVLGGMGTTLGDQWPGAAQLLVYCEYLGYLGLGY
jgi:hypothetical protein